MGDVVGVDGCRGGWAVAGSDGITVASRFAAVVARPAVAVAVDMPIGLPDAGRRACDADARRLLGPRRSSVFPAPHRPALGATSFADVEGLSRQAWNLVPKVREVDEALDPASADRVVEAHPEVSFAVLGGGPMRNPKRTVAGRAERVAVLAPVTGPVDLRVPGTAPDDVLDALVLRWTAARWARGDALVLGDGAVDARGLPMRIVA